MSRPATTAAAEGRRPAAVHPSVVSLHAALPAWSICGETSCLRRR
jgi:hypothetical protein